MRKGSRNYEGKNLERVRRLRSDASLSEDCLWAILRNQKLGFKFKRQYPIGPYVLDYYCSEANLAIEVDGEQHLHTIERDHARDRWVLDRGVETLRIPSIDLFDPTDVKTTYWIKEIRAAYERRTGRRAFPE